MKATYDNASQGGFLTVEESGEPTHRIIAKNDSHAKVVEGKPVLPVGLIIVKPVGTGFEEEAESYSREEFDAANFQLVEESSQDPENV